MPTISRFFGIAITMYFDDHGPPHFHARHADGAAKVASTLSRPSTARSIAGGLRLVLARAELHQNALAADRRRARAGANCADRAPPMIGLTPDVTEVRVVDHGVLRMTFEDGVAGEVDVLDRMRGPVFERARTLEGFTEAALDPESGTVTWPGGADLAPDTLYQRVRTGVWPEHDAPPD